MAGCLPLLRFPAAIIKQARTETILSKGNTNIFDIIINTSLIRSTFNFFVTTFHIGQFQLTKKVEFISFTFKMKMGKPQVVLT